MSSDKRQAKRCLLFQPQKLARRPLQKLLANELVWYVQCKRIMVLQQSLVQKQSQQLVFNQALRQSIKVLRLSNQELAQHIQKELLENPALELDENAKQSAYTNDILASAPYSNRPPDNLGKGENTAPQIERHAMAQTFARKDKDNLNTANSSLTSENYSDYASNASAHTGSANSESKNEFIQNALQSHESLGEHLLRQLHSEALSPVEQKIGAIIISDIDARGYLRHDLSSFFGKADEMKRAQHVLQLIQSFDPIGCGAANLAQALLLQARHRKPDDTATQLILERHFSALERLDLKAIADESGLSDHAIQSSLQFIRSLEPYPGYLHAPPQTEYILPDLIVVTHPNNAHESDIDDDTNPKENEDALRLLEVVLADEWVPQIQIGKDQQMLLEQLGKNSAEYAYLKENLQAAQNLLHSIKRRKQTLLRVMRAIVEQQKDFFLKGPEHLRPLVLRIIAQKLKVHESTISRAIANKYVQTQWGYFSLKYFFTPGINIKNASATLKKTSNRNIQKRIANLIQSESAQKPLSDQNLLYILKEEGIQVARRTIAKYRDRLGIASVIKRRKLKRALSK